MAAIKTWNATALTGGASRALDAFPTASLTDGDRAFVYVSGVIYYYEYNATATTAESSPDYIRPDDYSTAGVWVLGYQYSDTSVIAGSGISVSSTGNDYTVSSPLAVSAVQPARTITAGDGLTGGGDLSANRSLAVDSTVVRTTRTITAGGGLTGGGDLSANRTISHSNTSSQASVNNSGATVIQDVSVDTYGHVTSMGSVAVTASLVGAVPVTGGTFTGGIGASQFSTSGTTYTFNINMSEIGGSVGEIAFSDPYNMGSTYTYISDSAYGNIFHRNDGVLAVGNTSLGGTSRVSGANEVNLVTSGSDMSLTDGGVLRPAANAGIDLGTLTIRWGTVYCVTLDQSSDERLKNLKPVGDCSWLYNLNTYRYTRKGEDEGPESYGFSAQEVHKLSPNNTATASYDKDEDSWGLRYTELIAPMLQLIKDQKSKIDDLESRIAALEAL